MTASIKYPLLASVKAGAFRGALRNPRGVHMAIGVPEIYGTARLWIGGGDGPHIPEALYLWIEFDLDVFGVEHKAKFAVLPIS